MRNLFKGIGVAFAVLSVVVDARMVRATDLDERNGLQAKETVNVQATMDMPPSPTEPPTLPLPESLDKRADLDTTCAWYKRGLTTYAMGCHSPRSCVYYEPRKVAGCCLNTIDTAECNFHTTCLDSDEYTSQRKTKAIDTERTLACTASSRPSCYRINYYAGPSLSGYSILLCNTIAGTAWGDSTIRGLSATIYSFPTSTPDPSPSPSPSPPIGAIVGGVVGGLAVLALVIIGIALLVRHSRKTDNQPQQQARTPVQPQQQARNLVQPQEQVGYPVQPPGYKEGVTVAEMSSHNQPFYRGT